MNLLITGAWQDAGEYIEAIEKQGHQVRFLQLEKDELPCDYEWVEGVICNSLFLSHSINRFSNLRYIQLTSAGFDRVPLGYINQHNIKINNARGVYSAPMAEYAIAGVLSLYKSQRFFAEKQKEHRWEKKRDLRELSGQKVCIFGCGSVGAECAKRFNAFDCLVWGIDIRVPEDESFSCVYQLSDSRSVLAESDIVIITLPLTEETHHMFSKEMFEAMKPGAVVVNIARGALVDTGALIEALKNKLSGAVLDVFEEEPLNEDNPLWDMENVVITPHNSFVGNGNNRRMSNVIMRNLEKC